MILGRPSPPGRIVVAHGDPEKAQTLARILRGAGHRVTIIEEGRRVVPTAIEASPDLFIAGLSFADPPLASVIRSARQALPDLPVLVIAGGEDSDSLIEADEMLREPIDAGELDLRVSGMLRAQAEHRRLQRRADALLGLYKISWAFSLAAGPSAYYEHLARQTAQLLKADKGLVLLFDPERRLIVAQPPGFGCDAQMLARIRYPVDGEARARWNFRKNGPLMSNTAASDTRLLSDVVVALDLHSVLVAPLIRGSLILGLLLVADRSTEKGGRFAEEDLDLLVAVAAEASGAVENLRLHEELKRANALLQEYDRLKSEFVAIVAHDFRRPLMAIRGFAELVLEEPDIDPDARQEFMKTVITETEGLARLAEDTLLITRIETGEFEYQWSEIDLGPFILDSVPLGLSEHSILMDIPAAFPRMVADSDRLRQVITNLITNAIKYSPEGGSITIRCRERGPQHAVIEVIDHGLGIPADQLGKLFQKFQRVRTEEHMKISGTGLGLYICRLIVEGHGGQIWVESEVGKGSTFGFVIPLDARAARAGRRATTASPSTRQELPGMATSDSPPAEPARD